MSTGLQVWSATAASNATADSAVNWAEGMAPSAVNDSARAEMASAAKFRDDNNGTIVTTGTTAAFTATSNQTAAALTDGYTVALKFHANADAGATYAHDGLTAKPLQSAAGTAVVLGNIVAGQIQRFTYSSTGTGQWIANNFSPTVLAANQVVTPSITDANVTLPKLAAQANNTVVGNGSGGSASPVALALSGFVATTTGLAAPFPPAASFKNLSIKVASNTTVTCAADAVTMASTSGAYLTLPASGTVNMATNGTTNALDTGSLASGTWYPVWAIASSTSTAAAFLASTSFTTPLLPSPNTFAARVGAVVTSTSTSGQNLMGTWQYGRRAQYVVGLAQTTVIPNIANGVAGSYNTASPTLASVTVAGNGKFVPTTATEIFVEGSNAWKAGAASGIVVAPSTAWGGTNMGPFGSAGQIYPISISEANISNRSASILLESTAIAWAADNTGGAISCLGWTDNI